MKRIRELLPVMLSILCFWCLVQSILYGMILETGGQAQVVKLDIPCQGNDADALQNKEDLEIRGGFTFWKEKKGVSVTNPQLNREAKGTVLFISGRSGLVLDSSRELGVQQKRQCLVDHEMAFQLFGSTEASGRFLTINGTEYQVAGTLYHAQNAVLIQQEKEPFQAAVSESKQVQYGADGAAGEGWETSGQGKDAPVEFDYASVSVMEGENPATAIKRFEEQTGLSGVTVPNHLYRVWGKAAAWILPIFLLLSLFFEYGRLIHPFKGYPVIFFLLLMAGLFALALFTWILDFHFYIPKDYLPSRWSDFQFWPSLWLEKWKSAVNLVMMEKTLPLQHDYTNFLHALCYGGASLGLSLYSIFKWKPGSGRKLFGGVLLFFTLAFLTVVGSPVYGRLILENKIVWLLIPAFLCFRYLLVQFQETCYDNRIEEWRKS